MTVRSSLRGLTLSAAIALVAGCAGPAASESLLGGPTARPSAAAPSPSSEPTPAVATVSPFRPTARPLDAPADESMPASASAERNGVKVMIRLGGGNPMYAGNGALAFVTIENTGDRVLRWTNDGCDTNAGIIGITEGTWRDSSIEVSPTLAPYRDWLREEARVDGPIWLRFGRGQGAGHRFSGCADLGLPKELAPGRTVTQEFRWDGFAAPRLGLPPTGPATLTSRFERWTRPGPGPEGNAIEVTLDSWVLNGRPEAYLSPAEAIDAALADERLASWLVTRPLKNGADAIAEYDRDLGLWAVGLLMYHDEGDPILHAAFVDPITGEVVAIREHRVTF